MGYQPGEQVRPRRLSLVGLCDAHIKEDEWRFCVTEGSLVDFPDDDVVAALAGGLWLPRVISWRGLVQDMVLLHHDVVEETAGGGRRRHSATLVAVGESEGRHGGQPVTAMAKTVGLPVAIAAQVS